MPGGNRCYGEKYNKVKAITVVAEGTFLFIREAERPHW